MPITENLENKLAFFSKNVPISLSIIAIIAITIRLWYLPNDIPLTFDAVLYFWYANDLSILGQFPEIRVLNNGWPTFLSIFFYMNYSENYLDFMLMQRIITISLSIVTVIPVYLLCRKFFDKMYSLLGASIFVLEPRIIQNSLLGITEPLYLLLYTISIVLFLSSDSKKIFASFAIVALCTLVRSEGMFLFFALTILYFIRFRKHEKSKIAKYGITITIFILVLLPMASIRIDTMGDDGLFSRAIGGLIRSTSDLSGEEAPVYDRSQSYVIGLENLIRFLGWTSIPIFIIFVPVGAILLVRNRNFEKLSIIVTFFVMLVPALFAYSWPALDVRYLFVLYPLYCVASILAIKFFIEKFKIKKNILLVLIFGGIILLSITFLEIKMTSTEHQKESIELANHVANIVGEGTVFHYGQETGFLDLVGFSKLEKFPILNQDYERLAPNVLRATGLDFVDLEEYIEFGKERGLTHLVLDGTDSEPDSFRDAFHNEEKYSYLNKKFDSINLGYDYHLKIFQIDYEQFDVLKESD